MVARDAYPAVEADANEADLLLLLARTRRVLKREADQRIPAVLGIPSSQAFVLFHLARDSSLSCEKLAQLLGCTASHMTRLIQSLERRSLVRSWHGNPDRRTLQLKLTADGEALASRVPHVVREFGGRVSKLFTDSEQGRLLAILARMVADVGVAPL